MDHPTLSILDFEAFRKLMRKNSPDPDTVLLHVDQAKDLGMSDEEIVANLKASGKPFVVLNKRDSVKPPCGKDS